MMKVKKWGVILLLFGLLFNTTGYYFSFIVTEVSAKMEAWARIHEREEDNEEVVFLHFNLVNGQPSASELTFLNETEFVYNGHLYDLISRRDRNGVSTFKCYSDAKETEAVADLSKHIEAGHNQQRDNHKPSPLKNLLKHYFDSSSRVLIVPPVLSKETDAIVYIPSVTPLLHSVITPPPDCCFV